MNTCYIGVVGPETIPTQGMLSILNIRTRPGDTPPNFIMATKGYEARQKHINQFLESEHDWLLLLDHDMLFAEDTLERLRSHNLPYVTGYYMRRRFAPMVSVWFEPYDGAWPMMPYTAVPERNSLVELGASGWGCILLHRDVIEAVRPLMAGEWEVLEDDMDVWADTGEPFRYTKDPIGSDLRFPLYAQRAGYTLWGDTEVRPRHLITYPLSPDDLEGVSPDVIAQWDTTLRGEVEAAREEWRTAVTVQGRYEFREVAL